MIETVESLGKIAVLVAGGVAIWRLWPTLRALIGALNAIAKALNAIAHFAGY
jgi:hypothetical protein